MKAFWKALSNILLTTLSLIIFLALVVPLFLIVFVSLYIWRLLLRLYVKITSKTKVRIMGGNNPVVAIDDLHTRPLSTIVAMGAFEGYLDFEVATAYAANIVNATTSSGSLLFPEAHQYYETWMGYLWWKWEENFQLMDHIKLWDSSQLNRANGLLEEADIIDIFQELESMPFPKRKSPWEIFIVHNVILKNVSNEAEAKTMIIFRFHHGLCDGLSLMQLFMNHIFDFSLAKIVQPKYVQRSKFQEGIQRAIALLQLPYEFVKQGFVALDINSWHLSESKLTREILKGWTKRIPMHIIKEIKRKHGGVGFTAVLTSVLSGALRSMMLSAGIEIPKKIHAIIPLPWPGHPPGLCNYWSYAFMTLPVGLADRCERLDKCNRYVERLKNSITPLINFGLLVLFNLLPTWIIKFTTFANYCPTVIFSNFPGPPPGTTAIGGLPLIDTCFTGGPLRGNIGISITILSYDAHLRIVVGVDKAIFPKTEMINELVNCIESEFYLTLESLPNADDII